MLVGLIFVEVVEEKIVVEGCGELFDLSEGVGYIKMFICFDCIIEFFYGDLFVFVVLVVWQFELDNGLGIYGIEI